MTKEEFRNKYGFNFKLADKYGFIYLTIDAIVTINRLEKLVEAAGFTVKRITKYFNINGVLYSEIYYNEKIVGTIDLQGFPSIIFDKGKRKLASLIEENELVIPPIKGVHRILEWHTVKGKRHCLAGGETVLHCLPTEMTEDFIKEQIPILKLEYLLKYVKE